MKESTFKMHKGLWECSEVKTEMVWLYLSYKYMPRNYILFLSGRRKEGPFRIIFSVLNFSLSKQVPLTQWFAWT